MTTRLLGFFVANGYASEARVCAALLAHRDRLALDPRALFQRGPRDAESFRQFGEDAHVQVQPMDFGWRSMASNRRLAEKVAARLRFMRALPRALKAARQWAPDAIYSSQQFWDCQAAAYVARRLNKPQIIHLHYNVGPWLHQPVLDRLRTCAKVVAISDFIREEALRHGVPAARVATIRNSVAVPAAPSSETRAQMRWELGIAPDAPLLGIVARLDPDKGQADTLRAFVPIARQRPDAYLLVVGEPTPWHQGYDRTLSELARELGVENQVRFLGQRKDVPRLLGALDVFVHPSRREPFGLATGEASAAGLPVVAYAEGGTLELVEQEVTGLLAPPGDVDALSGHLARLIEDPVWARALGAAGRQKMAAEFRPEDAGQAFSHLISSLGGSH